MHLFIYFIIKFKAAFSGVPNTDYKININVHKPGKNKLVNK